MFAFRPRVAYWWWALTSAVLLAGGGCHAVPSNSDKLAPPEDATAVCGTMPRELCKTVLPTYVIEPPDILMIDAVHIVPRSPYRLRTLDMLRVYVAQALPDAPINGVYPVELGGIVNLGPPYGTVPVGGMTVDEAHRAIEQHLRGFLKEVTLALSLADIAAKQQIAGPHLVGPDGTVTLGSYGSVMVVGLTMADAKLAIERHLAQFLEDPEISLDVFAYNSKVFYIVTQGAGMGDGVYRLPVTGNETVLDAISQINGLTAVSSKRIWIARPAPGGGPVQVLPVDWQGITAKASTETNYQVLPGDRIFIAEDKLIAMDSAIARLTAPFERIMGFSLLGVGTATRFSGNVLKGGGNPGSNF